MRDTPEHTRLDDAVPEVTLDVDVAADVEVLRAGLAPQSNPYPGLRAFCETGAEHLVAAGDEALRDSVRAPAARVGVLVDEDLITAALQDLRADTGPNLSPAERLPLLGHALRRAWSLVPPKPGGRVSLHLYRAAGGLQHAVELTDRDLLRDLVRRLGPQADGLLDQALQLLVRHGSVPVREHDPVVEALVDAGLVTIRHEGSADAGLTADGTSSVDGEIRVASLAHDVLRTTWPRLHALLDADDQDRRAAARWAADARAWALHGRDPRLLADRTAVEAMERCLRRGHRAGPDELPFLTASRARLRGARRRRRAGVAALVAVAVAAAAGDVVLLGTGDRQRTSFAMARMADRTSDLRLTDPSLAAQFTLAAHRTIPSLDSRARLVATEADPLAVPLTGPTAASTAAAWSRDGRLLAVGSRDRTVRLWAATSTDPNQTSPGSALGRITPVGPALAGASNDINRLAFSPDGRLLAAGIRDGTIRIWDVTDPAGRIPAPTVLAGQHRGNLALAFAADSSALVGIALDLTVQRWDVATGTSVITPIPSIPSLSTLTSVSAAAVAPDGRTVMLGSEDHLHVVTLPGPGTPATALKPLTWAGQDVSQLAVAPAGGVIAAGSQSGWVSLWRAPTSTGDGTRLTSRRVHDREIRDLAFTTDGSRLASGGRDGTAQVWDVANPEHLAEVGPPFHAGIGVVWGLAFDPGGDHVLAATDDVRPRVWSLPTGVLSRPDRVRALAWSPDGATLATAEGSAVRLWNVTDARTRPVPRGDPLPGTSSSVRTLTWSGDGRLLAAADDGAAHLWNVHDPNRPTALATVPVPDAHGLGCLALSRDGTLLFVGDKQGTIHSWNIADPTTPQALPPVTTGRPWSVNALATNLDGHLLAAVAGNVLYLWDLSRVGETGPPATVTDISTNDVRALAFHPDGRTLATGADDTTIRLWDVSAPMRPLARGLPLLGHRQAVTALAFSPDGTTLVSGSRDMSLRWWDVTRPDRARAQGDSMDIHTDAVTALAYRPDGRILASADLDWTTRLWDLDEHHIAQRICAAAAGALDRERWDQIAPEVPYAPPCGP